jgi:WD40 repeat protein
LRSELHDISPSSKASYGVCYIVGYVSNDNSLMLYNAETRTETQVLENVDAFLLSPTGHIAFTKFNQYDGSLYIYDPATPNVPPQNISPDATIVNTPRAWSPDGKFLAFTSCIELKICIERGILHVWDGDTITKIEINRDIRFSALKMDWSNDGSLAFIIHTSGSETYPFESYTCNNG